MLFRRLLSAKLPVPSLVSQTSGVTMIPSFPDPVAAIRLQARRLQYRVTRRQPSAADMAHSSGKTRPAIAPRALVHCEPLWR
jgi:hypothetical protein